MIATLLETAGHRVFLPHRDGSIPGRSGKEKGLLAASDIPNIGRSAFEANLARISSSDALVALLDGLCWGTTFELGYAWSYKQFICPQLLILGIYTDPLNNLDFMRTQGCDEVITSLDQLPLVLNRCAAKQHRLSNPVLNSEG